MDETIDIVFRHGFSNTLGAFNMDILKGKVLGWIVPTDQIVDHIGVSNTLFERGRIPKIIFHENYPSQVSRDLQMPLRHLFPEGDDDSTSS